MSVKVFLLGATGYIGSAIAQKLLSRKEEFTITALVRGDDKIEVLQKRGIKTVKGSLDDLEIIGKEAYSADVIIHAANCDHLESATAIAEAIHKKFKDTGKKNIYLHTSGTGLCIEDTQGNSASTHIYDDDDEEDTNAIPATHPHRHVDTYLFHSLSSFPLAVIAPSIIYGAGDTFGGIANPLTIVFPFLVNAAVTKQKAQLIGKGLNIWSTVSLVDTAEFYVVILDKFLKGEVNKDKQLGYFFLENGEANYNQITQAIADILFKKELIPTKELNEVNGVDEASEAFAFPFAWFFGTNSRVKSTKARRLGWTPKDSDFRKDLEKEVELSLARRQ